MMLPTMEPLIPSSLWLALAVGAVLLWLWYARRRPAAIAAKPWAMSLLLMALGMALVLYVLLNPTWVERVPPPAGKPVLTVLVDATTSMATGDSDTGGKGTTRYAAAVAAAEQAGRELSDRFEVRIKSFADAVTPSDAKSLAARQPTGDASDLAMALSSGLENDLFQGQAILLLSDGIHNMGGASRVMQSLRSARALGAPVFTQTFGGEKSQFDVAVEVRTSQDLAFVGQKVPVTVRVRQAGGGPVIKTELRLMLDGKEVEQQAVELPAMREADSPKTVEARFLVSHDKAGIYSYEVSVPGQPTEASAANNVASYLLRVVNEPIRVLVLEGKPYWDSKFLLRTLGTDPAVALDSVVKMAEGRFIRRTISGVAAPAIDAADPAAAPVVPEKNPAALPVTQAWQVLSDVSSVLSAEQLQGYQIVVLGRDAEVYLSDASLANLTSWIAQEGGSLVCHRGSPTAQVNQKLGRLMPVKWTPTRETRVRMKLTEQGKELQWGGDSASVALLELPTLASAAQVDASKALAVVLAMMVGSDGGEAPAVVYQPYGSGRVVVLEGAGMWRWAFLPPAAQGQPSEELYGSMWHSLLRWLVSGVGLLPGQTVLLRTDKVTFGVGDNVTLTLLTRDTAGKPPQVELLADGGGVVTMATAAPSGVDAGSHRVALGKLPEGRYTARLAGSSDDDASSRSAFTVRAISDEQLNLAARPDLMRRIADETGGQVLGTADITSIASRYDEFMEKSRPAELRRTTAWDKWWVLLAVIVLWTATWSLRRRGGLV